MWLGKGFWFVRVGHQGLGFRLWGFWGGKRSPDRGLGLRRHVQPDLCEPEI